jgi:hypothetical protein
MLLSADKTTRNPFRVAVNSIRLRGFAFSIACIAFIAGCKGAHLAEVSGRVTLDGKPLSEGLVTFRPAPETAGPEFSGQVANGEYRVVKSVLPGTYSVQVRSWQKTGRTVESPLGKNTEEIIDIIPTRYASPGSELSAVLASGPNSVNFDLKN